MVRFERPYMVPFHESLITLILVGQALRHFRRDIAVGARHALTSEGYGCSLVGTQYVETHLFWQSRASFFLLACHGMARSTSCARSRPALV